MAKTLVASNAAAAWYAAPGPCRVSADRDVQGDVVDDDFAYYSLHESVCVCV